MIQGIVPPLVTPLSNQDALDGDGLQQLIEHQIDAGVDGLFVLGTTGEGPSLSASLRAEMIAQSGRLIDGRVPMYVGITDTSLVDAVKLAGVAAEAGAAAVVAAPPFYFPAGQTELRGWFQRLADALPLPLLLYNMPSCTKIAIELPTVEALIDHPNIVGLKDSSGDLKYLGEAVQLAAARRPDWPVLVGPEALLVEAMGLGAVGGVAGGANLAPKLFTELFAAVQRKDQATIDRLQPIVIQLQTLYGFGKYGSSYLKGLKCALDLRGICSGLLAAPFDVFKPADRQRVATWLDGFADSGFLAQ
ncbi:dihydrodipicolinate synthase family protein [Rosistilla oblonga]|uniref:dihydrodipicolinate synthase family protein n=1 Tax=Rosistilla oblonga TaxID=2527990 RepID=UPI003A985CE8